ncbi:VanZ family protein [Uliginosibacterium gangwonense]|uniref:VanZ family protein n=1 Tax=Uliginosibacterium gangwonense TaxID=392736 RepID=UPI00037AD92E|nr:VanZ family protein [Uliginosibacterium gangwonense]
MNTDQAVTTILLAGSNKDTHRLSRYLGFTYLCLTAYACLWPFDDYRSISGSPLEFLFQGWPRYFILSDFIVNILGFIPLGFLVVAARRTITSRSNAVITSFLVCTLYSFSLEFCQNYLVSRVASNLDLTCNSLGALIGALAGLRWRHILLPGGWFHAWRMRRLPAGHRGEIGMLLVLAWWLTQSEPLAPLFSNGDLRPVFDLLAPISFSVRRFVWFEAAGVAFSLLAFGLFIRCGLKGASAWLLGLLVLIGAAIKTIATSWFVIPPDPLLWASPGALWGMGLGAVALAVCWRLRPSVRLALANLALLLATVLINLAPGNPFEEASQHLIRSGHFIGFRSLTLDFALLWPFCALSWLAFTSSRR